MGLFQLSRRTRRGNAVGVLESADDLHEGTKRITAANLALRPEEQAVIYGLRSGRRARIEDGKGLKPSRRRTWSLAGLG